VSRGTAQYSTRDGSVARLGVRRVRYRANAVIGDAVTLVERLIILGLGRYGRLSRRSCSRL
jgi:hypothetical protein